MPSEQQLRPALQCLKEMEGLIGVEIGVSIGVNAECILKNLDIERLYLVDPYDSGWRRLGKKAACWEEEAHKRLDKHGKKIVWIKSTAFEAAPKIPRHLDFVYIDGDHSYEAVKKDIAFYYPKVRMGGVFGGHDYEAKEPGVTKAVNEFIEQTTYELHHERWDWWLVK